MESIFEKCVHDENSDANLLQKHIPCYVGSYWVSKIQSFQNGDCGKYKEFKGPTCIADFVNKIEELVRYIFERNKTTCCIIKSRNATA